MSNKWHFFHKWETTCHTDPSVYEQFDYFGPTASRLCVKCGKKQRLEVHCLGLNPPEFFEHWVNE